MFFFCFVPTKHLIWSFDFKTTVTLKANNCECNENDLEWMGMLNGFHSFHKSFKLCLWETIGWVQSSLDIISIWNFHLRFEWANNNWANGLIWAILWMNLGNFEMIMPKRRKRRKDHKKPKNPKKNIKNCSDAENLKKEEENLKKNQKNSPKNQKMRKKAKKIVFRHP